MYSNHLFYLLKSLIVFTDMYLTGDSKNKWNLVIFQIPEYKHIKNVNKNLYDVTMLILLVYKWL
jgi:hypothetical protein